MRQLCENLKKEEKRLENLITETTRFLKEAPVGSLRVSHCGKSTQYYHKSVEDNTPSKQGKYIKKENIQLAKDLAQKDYDRKLLCSAQKNLKLIKELLLIYQNNELEEVQKKLKKDRKSLINPRVILEENYRKSWENKFYQGKTFEEGTAEIYSNKGERVRSKSEKIIADMLYKNNIPYQYEVPLNLKGFGVVYPDFTLLNLDERKEVYWEHFGLMDNMEYCEKALRKIEVYQRNGLLLGERLLITYETSRYPLENAAIERNLRKFCK